MCFGLSSVIKLFKSGNVLVCGLRGTGKDMLLSNVVARRKSPYVSNIDYRCKSSEFISLDLNSLDIKNTYKNFVSGEVVPYSYPYPERSDIYISDAGVYFPSQFEREL